MRRGTHGHVAEPRGPTLLRIFIMKESKICIQLSLSIHQDSRDEIRQKTTNKLEKNNLLKWDNKCSQ